MKKNILRRPLPGRLRGWSEDINSIPDQNRAEKTAKKRARARQKPNRRITQLVKEGRPCFLLHLDTIVTCWNGFKRYILTAVDHITKLSYARMYKNKSFLVAVDFLYRLHYFVNQCIENLQTDRGKWIRPGIGKGYRQIRYLRVFIQRLNP